MITFFLAHPHLRTDGFGQTEEIIRELVISAMIQLE
jgi:hypothetical protein